MFQRHRLTVEQWRRLDPLLPGRQGDPGRTAADHRLFVNAVRWIAKTGARWRDLPERSGKWNSVFQRINRWHQRGMWPRIAEALNDDLDREHWLPDATIIRAH